MLLRFLSLILFIHIPGGDSGLEYFFSGHAKTVANAVELTDGNNPIQCSERVLEYRKQYDEINGSRNKTFGVQPTVSLGSAMLIFILVGVIAAGIAQGFQMVRRYIYHDADNLDTAFDAGGKVSIGLTATTIVSQWTWSATLLQSLCTIFNSHNIFVDSA